MLVTGDEEETFGKRQDASLLGIEMWKTGTFLDESSVQHFCLKISCLERSFGPRYEETYTTQPWNNPLPNDLGSYVIIRTAGLYFPPPGTIRKSMLFNYLKSNFELHMQHHNCTFWYMMVLNVIEARWWRNSLGKKYPKAGMARKQSIFESYKNLRNLMKNKVPGKDP